MTSDQHEIEKAFISTFVQKNRQNRWFLKINDKNKRTNFLDILCHKPGFIERFLQKIDRHQQSSSDIVGTLRSLGAPAKCHIISAHAEIDGTTLPLAEAVEEIVGFHDGTVIVCIPDKLAYWESEGLRERYILRRL